MAVMTDGLNALAGSALHTTLDSVASRQLSASDAIASIDAMRLLDHRAHHAWRAVCHLAGTVT